MPEEDIGQVERKKIQSAILSMETKRIIQGIMDGSIQLDVPLALEIVRNHIYQQPVREYLAELALRFDRSAVVVTGRDGRPTRMPIRMQDSELFKRELVKHMVMQSGILWTEIFRDVIGATASFGIGYQPERRARKKTRLEDLLK